MTCQLSVNLNAVAMLRNRRDLPWPSVVGMGRIALSAGAHGLTVHPRPDQRHIRRADVPDLAALIAAEFPDREFNIEGFPDDRWLDLVEETRPDQATLVPDDESQSTSDHGWDFATQGDFLKPIVARLKQRGIRVSVFVDPDPRTPEQAAAIGADRVEIYTGPYGGAFDEATRAREFDNVVATGKAAAAAGLGLNAGHDLTLDNLPPLVAALPNLAEVSIGHGLTADALIYGMAGAVKRYLEACAAR